MVLESSGTEKGIRKNLNFKNKTVAFFYKREGGL